MTPSARLAAAASVLDSIAQGRQPAEAVLKAWGAANRYAGSKDRRAIADRVYKVLRARGRLSWIMGGREDGRALVIGSLAALDGLTLEEIEALHSGDGYGPRPLSKQERSRITAGEGELPGWVQAGLPEFVVEDFKATFGDRWTEEARELMQPRAPIDLRVNLTKATVEEVEAELREAGLEPTRTPGSPVGLRLASEPPPNVQALEAFKAGRIEIQDEGSQIVCALAGAAPGMTVVDYCAGGGGKTLGLAADLFPSPLAGEGGGRSPTDEGSRKWSPVDVEVPAEGGETPHPTRFAGHLLPQGEKGRLIASDVVAKRLENIRPRLARAGVEAELRLIGQNGGGMEDLNGAADLVFVDAPCSGSGTWRRRPEDAWRLSAEEVERLHGLQVRILSEAARLVKPGGRLAYVTCSMLSRENEASADAFEAAHPDFAPVGARRRLSPASTNTDGFFFALYERTA